MVRKLSLSVIGAFWASKSVTCIASALLVSVFPANTVTQMDKIHCVRWEPNHHSSRSAFSSSTPTTPLSSHAVVTGCK